ncbi:MAG: LEPR-XLL domain-containing protein [Planctomycetaceae bacterium]
MIFHHFEQLEDRVLLAASVFQKGSVLMVSGTGAADQIDITGTGLGDVVVDIDNDGRPAFNFSGVESIKINLKGGGDELNVNALQISGKLEANMGGGNDEVRIFDSSIGSLSIITGGGADEVALVGLSTTGNVYVNTGGGNDEVDLGSTGNGATVGTNNIGGNLEVLTGGGSDEFEIGMNTISGTAVINGGGGRDELNANNAAGAFSNALPFALTSIEDLSDF